MRFSINNGVFIFVMDANWLVISIPVLIVLIGIIAYNIHNNYKRGRIIEGYDRAWGALGNLIPKLRHKDVFGQKYTSDTIYPYPYTPDKNGLLPSIDPIRIVKAQELFDKRKQQGIDYARITELKRIFKKINEPEE